MGKNTPKNGSNAETPKKRGQIRGSTLVFGPVFCWCRAGVGILHLKAQPYTTFLINDVAGLHATLLWWCRGVGFWAALVRE